MDEEITTVPQSEELSTNDEIEKCLSPLEEAIRIWSGDTPKRAEDSSEKSLVSFPAPSRDLKNSTDFIFKVCQDDFSVRAIKQRFTKSASVAAKWLMQENVKAWLNSLDTEAFFRRKPATNLLKTFRYCLIPITIDVGRTGDGVKLLTEFLNCLDRYFENFMEFWTITDLDDEFLDQIPFVPESAFFDAARGIILAYIEEKSTGEESSFEIQAPTFGMKTIFDSLDRCSRVLAALYANFEPALEFKSDHPFIEAVQEFSDALELFEDRIKILQFCKGQESPPEVFCCESYFELCKDLLIHMPLFYLSAFSHFLVHLENLVEKVTSQLPAPMENQNFDYENLESVDSFQSLKEIDLCCPLRCKETEPEKIAEVAENWRKYWSVARKPEHFTVESENAGPNAEKETSPENLDNEEEDQQGGQENEVSSDIQATAKYLKEIIFCLDRWSSRREEYFLEPEPKPEKKIVPPEDEQKGEGGDVIVEESAVQKEDLLDRKNTVDDDLFTTEMDSDERSEHSEHRKEDDEEESSALAEEKKAPTEPATIDPEFRELEAAVAVPVETSKIPLVESAEYTELAGNHSVALGVGEEIVSPKENGTDFAESPPPNEMQIEGLGEPEAKIRKLADSCTEDNCTVPETQ